MKKIAFRLNSDKAVEYANAHGEPNTPWPKYAGQYFHLPPLLVDEIFISDKVEEGYTDVTENFERDYWGPWKEEKDVASDTAPGIVPCDTSFDSCNTDGIGEEFMKWAEQYWRLREIVTIKDPDSFAGEVCDYDYMRGMFVKKIDGLIKERLSPPEVPQTLNIIK